MQSFHQGRNPNDSISWMGDVVQRIWILDQSKGKQGFENASTCFRTFPRWVIKYNSSIWVIQYESYWYLRIYRTLLAVIISRRDEIFKRKTRSFNRVRSGETNSTNETTSDTSTKRLSWTHHKVLHSHHTHTTPIPHPFHTHTITIFLV